MDIKDYTIDEHIHRFGVWTAARAASRGRLKNTEVEELIKQVDLKEAVRTLSKDQYLDETQYRTWIKAIGERMCSVLSEMKLTDYKTKYFCFGIAAKIISIYIKTVEVIPSKGQTLLSKVAYPPIDSILLKNLNGKYGLS